MKTSPLDFLLSSLCITVLVVVSALAVHLFSPGIAHFKLLFDVTIFLLGYGLATGVLLRLIRRLHPYPIGSHDMDSGAFAHWKLNAVLVDLAQKALAPFTTVFTETLFIRLFGARVGAANAHAGVLRDHPLLTFGNHCTIGQNSVLTAHAITGNQIYLAPIVIRDHAVVGINCTVMPGVELGEHSVLAPGAVATVDTKIPAHELWGGIPARKIKDLAPHDP
jgi:acetyltransferase-like isoleucine patch superfamily enzyme